MLTKALLFAALPGVLGLEVPSNVRDFYNQLKSKGKCDNKLATGFWNSGLESAGDMSYCGDHVADYGVVYLQGPGKFSNMDIDCDGDQTYGKNGDNRCNDTPTTQSQTSAKQVLSKYSNIGIKDLSPFVHSFVVFGNNGDDNGFPEFQPQSAGVELTSVMAVVCGDQMFYGVWGDSNGDDGERASVGEVSLALGTACYGQKMSGQPTSGSSHDTADILYIAFTGQDAVPGATGAKWNAANFDEFHASIKGLGDKLVARIGGNGTSGSGSGDTTCEWAGHCEGATCTSNGDCSGTLTCQSGKCAPK